jgi:LCP family protein required for cell wall assembly
MKKVFSMILWIAVIVSILTACGGGSPSDNPAPDTPQPVSTLESTLEPTNTPSSSSPTLEPSPTSTPTPTATPTPIPTPLPVPEGVMSIILLGGDRLPGQMSWRTDSMIYVRINPATKTVGMLSIPRDLWVYIPGYEYNRINTADYTGETTGYPGGGPALLNQTLLVNFGISFDNYIRVNFEGFKQVIDILDGIDVDVECSVELWGADPENPGGWKQIGFIPAGMQHLDGETALRYAQCRYKTPVFDRDRRQQKVLLAVRSRVLELGITGLLPRALELLNTMSDMIQTDLGPSEIMTLAQLVPQVQPSSVNRKVITLEQAPQWTTPDGAWVMLPDREKIASLIMGLLDPPPERVNMLAQEGARIAMRNGIGLAGWARQVADRLQTRGFLITEVGPADRSDHQETLIFVYNDKPYTVQNLQAYLEVKDENIRQEPDPSKEVDVLVILGDDFHTVCP